MGRSKEADAIATAKANVIMKTKARWALYSEGRKSTRTGLRFLGLRTMLMGRLGFRMGGPGSCRMAISTTTTVNGKNLRVHPPCRACRNARWRRGANLIRMRNESPIKKNNLTLLCRDKHSSE